MADDAYDKIQMSGSVQRRLEEESKEMRNQLTKTTAERHTLLCTTALLIGAIVPLYDSLSRATSERRFLMDCLTKYLTFKDQLQALVDALSPSNISTESQGFNPAKRTPILRFRSAVVTVMAANRLLNGSMKYCQLFTAIDPVPGVLSSIVCTGKVPVQSRPFVGE